MSSVQIDGNAIRALREEQGVTQLYLATVVGVTTDTISRWENRKYPSIKLENAEKLAEALEVPLHKILDQQGHEELDGPEEDDIESEEITSATEEVSPKGPIHGGKDGLISREELVRLLTLRRILVTAFILLLLIIIAILSWLYMHKPTQDVPLIHAVRHLPPHTAPNQPFPVIVLLTGEAGPETPVLLREEISGNAYAESLTGNPQNSHFEQHPRWIGKLTSGQAAFLYQVRPSSQMTMEDTIRFKGNCVSGDMKKHGAEISGQAAVAITPFHWADVDRNYSITDNEVLKAYEQYTIPGETGYDFSDLEALWLAGKYSWDEQNRTFRPQP